MPYRAAAQLETQFNLRASPVRNCGNKKPPERERIAFRGLREALDRKPGKWDYAHVLTTTNMLLGVSVINLGAAGGGLLPIAGALKDILLVGIAAELLGTVDDVDDRGDVGD